MKKFFTLVSILCLTAIFFVGCNEKTFEDVPYKESSVSATQLYQMIVDGNALNSNLNAMDITTTERMITYGLTATRQSSGSTYQTTTYAVDDSTSYKFKTDLNRPTLVVSQGSDTYIYRADKVLVNNEPAAMTDGVPTTASMIDSAKAIMTLDTGYTIDKIEEKTFDNIRYYKASISSKYLNSDAQIKNSLITSRMGEQKTVQQILEIIARYNTELTTPTIDPTTNTAILLDDMYVYFGENMCLVTFDIDESFPYNATYFIPCNDTEMTYIIDRIEAYNSEKIEKLNEDPTITYSSIYYATRYYKGIPLVAVQVEDSEIFYFENIELSEDEEHYNEYVTIYTDNATILSKIKQSFNTYIASYTFEVGINSSNIITMIRTTVLYYRPVTDVNTHETTNEAYYVYTKTSTLNDYSNSINLVRDTSVYNKF